MHQKIKVLDHAEAIKIAAGEVIERPAHIVKELIENSIDAGANSITLHLYASGKDLIKITDDGCGMSPEDAKLCFAHHATSKITTVNDLPSVATYGFRGEALSSIASVSHVELITKTAENKLATHLKLEHATFVSEEQSSHPTGTTMIISHLFDNIPARKKFLKADDTEWNLIVTIIQAFCLRYTNIHFKVFHNDYLAYNCPATTQIKNRCAQLWSNQLHDQLLEIPKTTTEDITVSGAISNMHYYRFNRGQIFTFVNNRWVKNSELSKAILKGYDGVLPHQKFPAAFIFVDIDPTEIDINIHPKKEEVKFLHPGIVQRVIQNCVKESLKITVNQKNEQFTPSAAPIISTKNISSEWAKLSQSKILSVKLPSTEFSQPEALEQTNASPEKSCTIHLPETPFEQEMSNATEQVTPEQPRGVLINAKIHDQSSYSIIGQFKKTYIMIEKEEQLLIIDQHAAHERILYERFKSQTTQVATINLLFPHIVKLTPHEIISLQPYQKLFAQHGILFEQFSDHELIIQATPVQMSAQSAQEVMRTALNWILQNQELNQQDLFTQLYEKILAEKACKASCRAGDTLNHEQMNNLIQELQKTENNFCCPHGRPTMWTMQLKDLEKQFKRDYTNAKQNNYDLL